MSVVRMPEVSQRVRAVDRGKSVAQIAVAYIGFAVIGLGVGFQGVAWPYIRSDFGLPLDAIGMLIAASTVGSIVSSFNGGLMVSLIGVGPLLALSSAAAALGLLGYSLAPNWWLMVLTGLVSGVGSGTMHVGLNAHFAANHGLGVINWLHACFGIGATLGPLVMTAILGADLSWRWAYGAAAVAMASAAIYFTSTRSRWSGAAKRAVRSSAPDAGGRSLATLKLPLVWLSLLLFFSYTGVEATAGQWAYSLFTEVRSVAESTAGFWMSVYWGGLAAGRLMLGVVADRFDVRSLLRLCIFCVILGAALIWWHPTDLLSFLGLALMGFAQGPIFPSLVSGTSRRVDAGHVDNTIGFQVAAASLGVAVLSSLAGVAAERITLEIIGPFLVACSGLTFVLHEMIVRRAEGAEA